MIDPAEAHDRGEEHDVEAMTMTIWTCVTSFVLRVMSKGVPNDG